MFICVQEAMDEQWKLSRAKKTYIKVMWIMSFEQVILFALWLGEASIMGILGVDI